MIYTCTFTPSIDYTVYLPEFHPGKLNRTEEVYYFPGGKGINVSRVLNRLQTKSIALGFAGGFTGDYIRDFLKAEGVQTDFIATNEPTRINVKIKADSESELNGPGPHTTQEQQKELLEKIKELKADDWFVLAGSLPDSIPEAFYQAVAASCHKKGIHFVLDTSGSALKQLIDTKPFLFKPNQQELADLFNTTINTKKEAIFYAKRLIEQGIKHVIVSMGGNGAILVTNDAVLIAEAPKGQVVNTVGAGDSLVSGFIAAYAQEKDINEAFRYGIASGSATAFRTDLCEQKDVDALVSRVTLYPYTEEDVN
ncbi:1-phosphofructokinase [Virgibacillus phasianinus]|uniref:Tagatose-6-phosphate kinase n=1 Tax=Virgibacillus phasianinus TaxID=2017483 RepID=A0A220U016_9BACI|nr:1-phosphofructokinase [Virgibacillus phasianinus]ASK61448.1 1-phosphofructokinase [Virgibacillus phasianinus]